MPVINVGMLGGGTVVNAIPREAWFTVDLRSLDSSTQDRLQSAVVAAAKNAAEAEKVGFSMEKKMAVDYSKALSKDQRLKHPLVQTAVAAANYFRKPGSPLIQAQDAGSTDANIAVSMGIPAVAVGAVIENMPHRLEETPRRAASSQASKPSSPWRSRQHRTRAPCGARTRACRVESRLDTMSDACARSPPGESVKLSEPPNRE